MAKMYPKDLSLYNPPLSEQKVFNALKSQLDNSISVFYSVSWLSNEENKRKQSECDFLIFDPKYGFLTCEVKGGRSIRVENGEWTLILDNEERKLKRSPMQQAEENSRYFHKLYSEEFNDQFKGVYGSIAIFPNFIIDDSLARDNRAKELVLDLSNMSNLADAVRKAFLVYKRNNNYLLTTDQKDNFLSLVHKRIAISAAAGSLIEDKERELESLNRVQENYLHFIREYNQCFIEGGAGTGKTWIAMKFISKYLNEQKSVLFTCYNKELISFVKSHFDSELINIIAINDLISSYGINTHNSEELFDLIDPNKLNKYDTIIVDEGQDCDEYIAAFIRLHLKNDNDNLYVFYDFTQNLFNCDFKNGFMIKNKPFFLRENLRNTSSIYTWAQNNTNLGVDVVTNQITGPKPQSIKFSKEFDLIECLENKLLELIDKEFVDSNFITILSDEYLYSKLHNKRIGRWNLRTSMNNSNSDISFYKVHDFKGLESNVIIYIHLNNENKNVNYVAYTRAKYFLLELTLKNE